MMDEVIACAETAIPTPSNTRPNLETLLAVGRVAEAKGVVTVLRTDGSRETLEEGDLLYEGDVIETATDGAVLLRFADGTRIALADRAILVIDSYWCDPIRQEGEAFFSILKGMFLFEAG
tara:strand:+ start:222 stop:581 length:360 start_codon:yes stop_codon:yes gene_type:complete